MESISNALWVERLQLTNFRSYASASVATDAGPQVIVGANGSGKTNLLEALSLLSPGQGLRRVPFIDLARAAGDGGFAVAARAHTLAGVADLGTGLQSRAGFTPTARLTPTPNPSPQGGGGLTGNAGRSTQGGGEVRDAAEDEEGIDRGSARRERTGRIVRIDGVAQSGSGVLADYLEIVWVTPAMDGLFTGPASERRRFLDRLILCFDHGYRTIANRFERAMTSRNRLLADGVRDNAQLSGFE